MRKLIVILLLSFTALIFSPGTNAQCPMCKTSVESAMKDKKNTKGKGLNSGILYLLSVPYLAVAIGGIAWYYQSKRKRLDNL